MYEHHPACLMQPDMSEENYQTLCESIRGGYQEDKPIALLDGMILDGRHRYKACLEVGIDPVFFTVLDSVDPYLYVYQVHKGRRHLSSQEQQVLVEAPMLAASDDWQAERRRIKESAKEARAKATKRQHEVSNPRVGETMVPPQLEAGPKPRDHTAEQSKKTATAKAKRLNVSRASVERADMIQRKDPALAEEVKQGRMTAAKAIREIKKAEAKRKLDEVTEREVEAPTGIYDVIVIDPPWPMKKIERDERPNQVEFDYPVMSEDELSKLVVPMADDCHVWLWTTHKFLPMAMRLLDAWKLKYVCTFVWHKPGGFQPVGLPQYNCEFALYARNGSPKFVDTKALPTCFEAPRGAHSEKPEFFYETLRRVTGGRRLDMFNRRKIKGFAGWGKEVAA